LFCDDDDDDLCRAQILHLVNLLLCGFFSRLYNDLNRKYKFVMHLVDVYGPFAFFKGW